MCLGYFLWQIDGIYCTELTALRRSVGMPWGFLLELHGWWHGLTAVRDQRVETQDDV
jgi:dihydroceramidase